jgi:hypothetical protein
MATAVAAMAQGLMDCFGRHFVAYRAAMAPTFGHTDLPLFLTCVTTDRAGQERTAACSGPGRSLTVQR